MKVLLAFPIVLSLILVSGCTGQVINKETRTFEPGPTVETTEPPTSTVQEEGKAPAGPCDGLCQEFSKGCPDGFTATCQSVCNSATGECIDCTPSCNGHDQTSTITTTITVSTTPTTLQDPCAGVTCPASTLTCPDGLEAACPNTCSGGSCPTCQPDCSGHNVSGGDATINEVMYNPNQCRDSYCEWIELFNPNPTPVDIGSWNLCGDSLLAGYIDHADGNTYLDSGTVIPANRYAILTDGISGTDVYSHFNVEPGSVALHVNTSKLCNGLVNTNRTIELGDGSGSVDSAAYSSSLGADGNGKSLELSGGQWLESSSNGGTPGRVNSV